MSIEDFQHIEDSPLLEAIGSILSAKTEGVEKLASEEDNQDDRINPD